MRLALRISGLYMLAGVLWILLSDLLLEASIPSEQLITLWAIFKGWLFVLVTGSILFALLRREFSTRFEAEERIKRLAEDLRRSNAELERAYLTTLEAWARTLEMRDKDTEGHTRRVTEMAVRLAEVMGLDQQQIEQIRKGGLLHDIGKMAIPDSILLKPGPLTKTEREVMQKHPVYARELISGIDFLRPALDIPYSHHERWDGAGYPEGLRGEQIPLAARIFAVADVWDALRSSRPYNDGRSDEEAREYIRSMSGSQFDPKVVEAFLSMDHFHS